MYQEDLARITADHLRTHIAAYLAVVAARYDDAVPLVNPKGIIVASAVGGLIQEFDSILPKYAVDVFGKTFATTGEDLNSWEYSGQISGLISASSQESADRLVKRHSAAVEAFMLDHESLHQAVGSPWNDDFIILSFGFTGVDLSGAEYAGDVNDREIWVAGFSFDCLWMTGEIESRQHA
jgi:hypothetical protein